MPRAITKRWIAEAPASISVILASRKALQRCRAQRQRWSAARPQRSPVSPRAITMR
ncbi:hypothetical protein KWH70_05975 [Xanthomonas campestris pv. ionidii]|nr:hypothetical protein [Xanthomonas campestris pv. ionidii]